MLLTIHMVSSVDGIVAKKDNSVSWFEVSDNYEQGVDAPDTTDFLASIDCYVMGSRTYEHALELSRTYGWAYGDKPTIVLSSRNLPVDRPNIELFSGGLDKLVQERLKPRYRNVWVVGGPMLAGECIRMGLADEIRLSVLPVIVGEGTHFFEYVKHQHSLHVKDVRAYKNGIVEICYQVSKDLKSEGEA